MVEGEVPSLLEDHFSQPKISKAIAKGNAALAVIRASLAEGDPDEITEDEFTARLAAGPSPATIEALLAFGKRPATGPATPDHFALPSDEADYLAWEAEHPGQKVTRHKPDPVPEASVLTRSQPTEADVRGVASILDHPSVYMGGPSRDSMRRAKAIVDLIWQRAQAALPVPADRSGETTAP